jgi:hypothetical protein
MHLHAKCSIGMHEVNLQNGAAKDLWLKFLEVQPYMKSTVGSTAVWDDRFTTIWLAQMVRKNAGRWTG